MINHLADDGYGGLIEVPSTALQRSFEQLDLDTDVKQKNKKTLAQEIAEIAKSEGLQAVPKETKEPKERKVRPSYGPKPKTAPTDMPSEAHFKLLSRILQSKRAHNSSGDHAFRRWLESQVGTFYTKAGNIVVTTDDKSDVMFSCHIDTCHSPVVSDDKPQKLDFDPNLGHIFLAPESQKTGHVLGADDGAGIYIMLRMIEAKVPGTYVFHIGEEVGCVGSRAMAREQEKWLGKFNLAVAFDRPQSFEVIHTQGGLVCSSLKCSTALALALSTDTLAYEPSANGVLTDTKHYRSIIPECLNIGVGYSFQHSPQEYQDVYHLEALAKRCCEINWSALPIDRDPYEPVKQYTYQPQPQPQTSLPKQAPKKKAKVHPSQMNYETLCEWVYSDTDDAVTYIVQLQAQLAAAKGQSENLAHLLGIKL